MTTDQNGSRLGVPASRRRGAGDWDVRTGARLDTARQWLDFGGSVLLHGPAERATSAALGMVTGCRRDRVLGCRTEPADAGRRYAVLSRLLESMSGCELASVAKARQGVLLALVAGRAGALSPLAVRIALLDLLRQVARQRPVLVVVDGVHHIDPDSAAVLQYVLSRVDDVAVRMAMAECTPGVALPRQRHLCPSPLLVVRVPPGGQQT